MRYLLLIMNRGDKKLNILANPKKWKWNQSKKF